MQLDSISIEKKKTFSISKEALDRPWVKCKVDLLITLHTRKNKTTIKTLLFGQFVKRKLLRKGNCTKKKVHTYGPSWQTVHIVVFKMEIARYTGFLP